MEVEFLPLFAYARRCLIVCLLIVVTATSLTNLQLQVALAQRQVAKDQAQVNADQAQLEQSVDQLAHDQRDLGSVQSRQRAAQNQKIDASTPTLEKAIESKVQPPAPAGPVVATPVRASVNARGESLGQLINVAA
jgi:hypothetical protein